MSFYGFSGLSLSMKGMPNVLIDTNGNQCALKMISHSPCELFLIEQEPNWRECTYNDTDKPEEHEMVEKMLDRVRIAPRELRPLGEKPWRGITLRQWINYIDSLHS